MKKIIYTLLIIPILAQAKTELHEIAVQMPENPAGRRIYYVEADKRNIQKKDIQIIKGENGEIAMSVYIKGQGGCTILVQNEHRICYLPVNNLRVEYRGIVKDEKD